MDIRIFKLAQTYEQLAGMMPEFDWLKYGRHLMTSFLTSDRKLDENLFHDWLDKSSDIISKILIENNTSKPEFINSGGFSDVWKLDNGRVLKITDFNETDFDRYVAMQEVVHKGFPMAETVPMVYDVIRLPEDHMLVVMEQMYPVTKFLEAPELDYVEGGNAYDALDRLVDEIKRQITLNAGKELTILNRKFLNKDISTDELNYKLQDIFRRVIRSLDRNAIERSKDKISKVFTFEPGWLEKLVQAQIFGQVISDYEDQAPRNLGIRHNVNQLAFYD